MSTSKKQPIWWEMAQSSPLFQPPRTTTLSIPTLASWFGILPTKWGCNWKSGGCRPCNGYTWFQAVICSSVDIVHLFCCIMLISPSVSSNQYANLIYGNLAFVPLLRRSITMVYRLHCHANVIANNQCVIILFLIRYVHSNWNILINNWVFWNKWKDTIMVYFRRNS